MSSHETRQLGDVCTQDRVSVKAGERGDLRYIGLEGIEPETGSFIEGELSKTPDAPKANSFYFTSRHVLYGKLRPYLNKVATPEFEGKCSTEIIPMLPDDSLNRDYLAYFLRSPQVVSRISRQTAGARMPRADMGVVLGLEIPVPSLSDQHSIVDILKRADGIRRLRKQAQDTARQLIPALFVDIFGDPVVNPREWPVRKIGELGRVQLGRQRAPKYQTGKWPHPYLRVANVFEDRIDLSDVLTMDFDEKDFPQYRLKHGDILLNEGQSTELVGRPAMWRGELPDCCFQNTLVRFQPDRSVMTPEFALAAMLQYYSAGILSKISSKTSNVAHLGAGRFAKLDLYCPPIELQRTFSARFEEIRSVALQQDIAVGHSELAFQALLNRAFSGDF